MLLILGSIGVHGGRGVWSVEGEGWRVEGEGWRARVVGGGDG